MIDHIEQKSNCGANFTLMFGLGEMEIWSGVWLIYQLLFNVGGGGHSRWRLLITSCVLCSMLIYSSLGLLESDTFPWSKWYQRPWSVSLEKIPALTRPNGLQKLERGNIKQTGNTARSTRCQSDRWNGGPCYTARINHIFMSVFTKAKLLTYHRFWHAITNRSTTLPFWIRHTFGGRGDFLLLFICNFLTGWDAKV